jgi:hypothetical protein
MEKDTFFVQMNRTEKILEKAQTIWETEMAEMSGLDAPVDVGNSWYTHNYQRLRTLLMKRRTLGFADGVFYTLAAVGMDEKKLQTQGQTFIHGGGI